MDCMFELSFLVEELDARMGNAETYEDDGIEEEHDSRANLTNLGGFGVVSAGSAVFSISFKTRSPI